MEYKIQSMDYISMILTSKRFIVMQMPILHRSLQSPYCEKIMLLMGYLEQPYLSLITSKGIPRPVQELLVGNYSRRVPILQIGADLFCDSELIMQQLSILNDNSSLYKYPSTSAVEQWIKAIEIDGNTAIFGSIKPLELICAYFKNMPPNHALKFITDRAKLAKTVALPNNDLPFEEKELIAKRYLVDLDNQLSEHHFFFTDNAPTALDFTAYTMIYYLDIINKLKLARELHNLRKWYQRMSAIGTGHGKEVTDQVSLAAALENPPAPIAAEYLKSSRIGQEVTFKNKGFMSQMNEGVRGVIVGEDENRIILRRETIQTGVVHIHFPKLNY